MKGCSCVRPPGNQFMTERALVTGGAGFVGRHLVTQLHSNGLQVRVLDQFDASDQFPPSIEFIHGSITKLDDARVACENIDIIYHLAGNAQLWARAPHLFREINTNGTHIMLDAACREGVRRFVQCSSLTTLVGRSTVIGRSTVDETRWLSADEMLGAYPKSKRCAEDLVLSHVASGHPMEAVIAIPTEPLGAGDNSITPPTRMILDFLNGKTPAYIDCMLNFVPVQALVTGLIAVGQSGRHGERYLLGGQNISMRDLLERLQRLSGRSMPTVRMPYSIALLAGLIDTGFANLITRTPPKAPLTGVRLAGRQVSFDSSKAKTELGWAVSPDEIDRAFADLLEWAKERNLYQQPV